MEREQIFSKVGEAAVSWNKVEFIVDRILQLYLDTDSITTKVIMKPLRATDREKLLRSLVAAKEIDDTIKLEINEALTLCAICRDNRNLVLHNAGGPDGNFASTTLHHVTRVCGDFETLVSYLKRLNVALSSVIYERSSRETPIDDESSSDDELLPDIVFTAPDRPNRPRRLQHNHIRTIANADEG
jgi:hypothetical protein|tara:strand:- start:830 stop:1387 length:558 start_codon:yes stop_codon:yes gene_type:complete